MKQSMNRVETALQLYRNGFNCAQSVLGAFAEAYGLPEETALQLACGLGGGLRSGEVCGAISGAALVVGLKYGHCRAGDREAKQLCYAKTVELMEQFRARKGVVCCRDILGCDLSTPEGREKAKDQFQTTYVGMVETAVCLLEELGY